MNTISLRVSCFAVSCVALFAGLHNPVFGKPKPPDPAEEESKRIKERRDAEFAAREAAAAATSAEETATMAEAAREPPDLMLKCNAERSLMFRAQLVLGAGC